MLKPDLVTIGVYGFNETQFFQALLNAGVDTFCDLRLRRGMRGSAYSFVNSQYLQRRLGELGIQYKHCKELAPSQATRDRQRIDDMKAGVHKRTRTALGREFIDAYERECLARLDSESFVGTLGPEARRVALFCVEREPEACHRLLVAKRLNRDLGLTVEHILP